MTSQVRDGPQAAVQPMVRSALRNSARALGRVVPAATGLTGPHAVRPSGAIHGPMAGSRVATALMLIAALLPAGLSASDDQRARLRRLAAEQARAVASNTHPAAEEIEVEVDPLDSRLNLTRCNHEPRAELGPGATAAGRTSVELRCDDPEPWRLYVSAHVRILAPVWVAANSLGRGERIRAGDLRQSQRDVSTLRRPGIKHRKAALGQTVRRRLAAGAVVSPNLLKKPQIVQRGQRVTIEAGGGALGVRMVGEALQSGRRGDHIRVRNRSSEKIIDAEVTADGRVRVER